MVRLSMALLVVLGFVAQGRGGEKKAKLERISAEVTHVLPRDDKIVLFDEPTPGKNLYWHVKPKEHKVKLLIDGKEVGIEEVKVKDKVIFLMDRATNTITEVQIRRTPDKGKPVRVPGEIVPNKFGSFLQNAVLETSDPKDKVRNTPSKTFTAKLAGGKTYNIELRSTKFRPILCVEDLDGKVLGDGADKDASTVLVTWEAKEDTTIRLVVMAGGSDGTGIFAVVIREKK